MSIATGVQKRLAIKKESSWGVAAGDTGAQVLRRVTAAPNLTKNTYQSQEIRDDYQISDFRHGTRKVEGNFNFEWSNGTYQQVFEAVLRAAAGAAVTTGAVTDIGASSVGNTLTRGAGSFISDGFRVGMVVRASGFTTTGTSNNNKNLRITALTATVMTVAETLATKTPGDSVTIAAPGLTVSVPSTGHTDDSFTIEVWNSGISVSEQFLGCKFATLGLRLPSTGMATLEPTIMGKDMLTDTAAYFTSPTAATETPIMAAVNGSLRLGGADVATVTGLSIDINGNMSTGEVIGSNTTPDVFPGSVVITGQATIYYENGDFLENFIDEDELELHVVLDADSTANSGFISVFLPRIKLGGNTRDDGQKGIVQTVPFTALKKGTATGYESTTIMVQDSSFA
jgi:hypothetical protein